MSRYVDVHPNHKSWHGLRRGDACWLPSGHRGVVAGMGEEGRIEVRYMDGKQKGHLVALKADLLRRYTDDTANGIKRG